MSYLKITMLTLFFIVVCGSLAFYDRLDTARTWKTPDAFFEFLSNNHSEASRQIISVRDAPHFDELEFDSRGHLEVIAQGEFDPSDIQAVKDNQTAGCEPEVRAVEDFQ